MSERIRLKVGDRVRFTPYKRSMTVQAVTTGGRFAILTQPFAAKKTVIYTVIDFERGVRGCDNHYGVGYETPEDIANALEGFQNHEDGLTDRLLNEAVARGENSIESQWEIEVSHRKYVPLDMQKVNDLLVTAEGYLRDGARGDEA